MGTVVDYVWFTVSPDERRFVAHQLSDTGPQDVKHVAILDGDPILLLLSTEDIVIAQPTELASKLLPNLRY